jgi:hypothetical protein
VPKPTSGDPHELHLLTFKTQPCKENCANVYLCTRFHSCEDRRRPLLIFADANVPNYQPVMCNALKGSAVCRVFSSACFVACALSFFFCFVFLRKEQYGVVAQRMCCLSAPVVYWPCCYFSACCTSVPVVH